MNKNELDMTQGHSKIQFNHYSSGTTGRAVGICLIGQFLWLVLLQSGLCAEPLSITTLAGSAWVGSQDGDGPTARFNDPQNVVADSSGNLFVTDHANSTIRKLTQSGTNWVVSTFAGSPGMNGHVDGTGSAARFSGPSGIAVDDDNNLFVTDLSRLRRITPGGEVTTLLTDLDLDLPGGLAVAHGTNLFLAIPFLNSIYVVRSNYQGLLWTVDAVIGSGTLFGYGTADGTNEMARFNEPSGVAVGQDGSLYVADSGNFTIRKITPDGTNWVVSTLAGNRRYAYQGFDGVGTNAAFAYPADVSVGDDGNIYVADMHGVRRVTPEGVVTTLAGLAGQYDNWVYADGTNSAARFNYLSGIFVDSATNVFVTDGNFYSIRQVVPQDTNWVVTTIAGLTPNPLADGVGDNARFRRPGDVVADNSGNVFVADAGHCAIRKVSSDGTVTTIAGVVGESDFADGINDAARFALPWRIAMDNSGQLFVADEHRIRKISPDGTNWVVTTVAGGSSSGSTDGTNTVARFHYPQGIAADNSGRLFVSDTFNHTIRMLTPNGTTWVVTTIAGSPGSNGSADGTNSDAGFRSPKGIVTDSLGRLYIADEGNNTIRLITPEGTNWVVTTPAGQPSILGGYADGLNNNSRFKKPADVALDPDGNLFVLENQNSTIRKIIIDGSDWEVTTVAGLVREQGSTDGVGDEARFRFPNGIDVDVNGRVYIADTGNDMIRISIPATLQPDVLNISLNESGVILSWPASAINYTLRYATDLPGTTWTTVPTPPTQVGNQLVVTNPITPGARFFQLQNP